MVNGGCLNMYCCTAVTNIGLPQMAYSTSLGDSIREKIELGDSEDDANGITRSFHAMRHR